MEHVRNVDFNSIIHFGLKEGLTVEETLQLAHLIGLSKSIHIRLDSLTISSLIEQGYVTDASIPLPKGLRVFKRLKTDNTDLARKMRELYPPGMKDDRWPWRGTTSSIAERLDEFNKMYPDITDEEMLRATTDYLSKFTEDGGRSLLGYFIWKTVDSSKRSILADWVYANRENKQSFKQKSNTDQL